MIDPLIIYTSEMDSVTKQMVDEYWGHQNGIFIVSTKDMSIKYGMPRLLILKKIKQVASYNKKLCNCKDCQEPISKLIYSRKEYRMSYQENTKCQHCSDISHNEYKEAVKFKNLKFLKELQPLLNNGIKEKNWLGLHAFDKDLLDEIIKRKEKSRITEYVFRSNYNHTLTWDALNKLHKLNLVILELDYAQEILDFHFDDHLESIMEADNQKTNNSKIIKDTFSFNLNKSHKDILNTEADYSGSFILEHDIILKGNIAYKYEAFIQSDGSINFKCAPKELFLIRKINDGFGQTFYSKKSSFNTEWNGDDDAPF